jgi:peptidyl-prolyl cis-trans isomerase D
LQKGENVSLSWAASRGITRAHAPQIAPEAVGEIFKVDAAKTPAYAGTAVPGGAYALYRIAAVRKFAGGADEPPAARALRQKYVQTVAEQELMAWMEALKARHEVKINKAVFEAKEK